MKQRALIFPPLAPRPAKAAPETWTIRLVSVPSGIPATIRFRRLLKACLRAYGFRAVLLGGDTLAQSPTIAPLDAKAGNQTPADTDAATGV